MLATLLMLFYTPCRLFFCGFDGLVRNLAAVRSGYSGVVDVRGDNKRGQTASGCGGRDLEARKA